jgi:acetyltransferase-like isoleucine patch superfamily enzyme
MASTTTPPQEARFEPALSGTARRMGTLTLLFVLLADPLALLLATLGTVAVIRMMWYPHWALQALLLVLAYFLFPVMVVLVLICLRGLFARRRPRVGTFHLSHQEARLWLRNAALASLPRRSFFKNAVTGFSFLGPLFLRGMGAKVGARVRLGVDSTIADPVVTVIGSDSLIGDGAFVAGHLIEGPNVVISPVTIGDHVTIGAHAFVCPGTRIGDRAIVAAGAVVAKGTFIPGGETWGGVPARKIGEVDQGRPDEAR